MGFAILGRTNKVLYICFSKKRHLLLVGLTFDECPNIAKPLNVSGNFFWTFSLIFYSAWQCYFGSLKCGSGRRSHNLLLSVKVKLPLTWVLQYWGGQSKFCTFVFQFGICCWLVGRSLTPQHRKALNVNCHWFFGKYNRHYYFFFALQKPKKTAAS